MAKDIDYYIKIIADECGALLRAHRKGQLGINAKEIINNVRTLRNAIDSFEAGLTKAYQDEEKLHMPAVKNIFDQIINQFTLLRKERDNLIRFRKMFEQNNAVTPEEYKDIPRLYGQIITLVDNILDLEVKLQDLIEQDVAELERLNDDIGRERKTKGLRNTFRSLRGAA